MFPVGVVLVHLVSGEDIIARVECDTEQNVYLLWCPMTPVTSPGTDTNTETGEGTRFRVSLIPYRPFLDVSQPLVVRADSVLFTGTLVNATESLYAQLSSSNGANDGASGGIPT